MKKTKLVIFILFIGLILIVITGCSNNEINNIMIIDSIGIDKDNDKYFISYNTYIGNDKYEVMTTRVDTLDESFEDIYLKANKKIYLSHLNILFLSSNLDNLDITNIINTFNNKSDLRGSFQVIMVNDYNKDILKENSLDIINLLKNNHQEIGIISPTSFNDIISNYLDMGISYIPVVNHNLNIIGTHSLFDEYSFYDIDESKYLNLVLDKSNTLVFNIDNEEVKVKDIDVFYQANKSNIKIKIYMKYISNLEETEIKNYIFDNANNFLNSEINLNYFKSLIKKYDYFNYSDNLDINFELELYLNKDNINNIKEDNIIEKD